MILRGSIKKNLGGQSKSGIGGHLIPDFAKIINFEKISFKILKFQEEVHIL